MASRKILLAAVGSRLRGDDGFGPAVLERLRGRLPDNVATADFGSHGIALVQALYDRYDALVLLDAARRTGSPGTIRVMKPHIAPPPAPATPQGLDALADAHVASPEKALTLAKALGVLPAEIRIVECEVQTVEGYGLALSRPVGDSVEAACREVLVLLGELSERALGAKH